MRHVAAALLVLATLAGCGGEPLEPQPRAPTAFPVGIVLEVQEVGQSPRRLTMADEPPADFTNGSRKAWRIAGLFGDASRGADAALEVYGADGRMQRVETLTRPEDDLVAVLTTNRRGEAVFTWIDPTEPFPDFHGRGGGRRRPGDPEPRMRVVTRVRLVVGGGTEAAQAQDIRQAMLELKLIVDGEEKMLTEEDLVDVDVLAVVGDEGKGERDAIPLRDLVRRVAGDGARVTAMRGDGHRDLEITPEAWADVARTPILRLNRRGQFKFHWIGAERTPLPGEELRNIRTIEIVTGR